MSVMARRHVRFNTLEINIVDSKGFTTEGQIKYGVTTKTVNDIWEPKVLLYLGHHQVEAHFVSTLLHEAAHCLVYETKDSHHNSKWLWTAGRLMTLIKSVDLDVNIDGHDKYEYCARQYGVNLVKRI